MQRLSAAERTRDDLRALMNGDLGMASGRSDLVRLALRKVAEEALEGELDDAPGRPAGALSGHSRRFRTGCRRNSGSPGSPRFKRPTPSSATPICPPTTRALRLRRPERAQPSRPSPAKGRPKEANQARRAA
jgi:hypothetical protein